MASDESRQSRAPPVPAPRLPSGPGLSSETAAQRLLQDGPNALPGGRRRTLASIALETLREPMFLLLLAAATLYLVLGDRQEGLTLLGFVLVTLGLTLYQEGKTEHAIEALRDLTSPRALVVRDGQARRIAGREVVRGDLLQLSEGDRVAADALLLDGDDIQADESLLTGEAAAVTKRLASGPEREARLQPAGNPPVPPGGDDLPVVFAGTLIVRGRATARVTATGARSEIGRIGTALATTELQDSPLQKQTARLVRNLAYLAVTLSLALVLVHGLLRGDWLQAWLAGIALAMSMLPEEYPVVLTVFPALAARRLAKQGVLTRRIDAIETLGAATVLCTDKTGTLTENRMTVSSLAAGGAALGDRLALGPDAPHQLPEPFQALVETAILASAVDPVDPMERAFQRLGQKFLEGGGRLRPDWRLVRAYPLSPGLRAVSQVWASSGGDGASMTVATKGAPEAVLDLCHLDPEHSARIASVVDEMARQGLRVLAAARGVFRGPVVPETAHGFDFEFVGLLGLDDPLRAQVPAAVAECRAAGIRVVMVTGDYPATARAIGQQAGLVQGPNDLLTGDAIDAMDDHALGERLRTVRICARIAPQQKLRIVQALQARGQIVAMTGDGVNDAPALRAAHVGVAMGARGTDVARESASLVLVDDDFAAIVRGVREGRRIFDNLRKAMSYVLAVHVPIAGMALLPVMLGWPALLYPMHIALLELIIDPACSIAFENEPADAKAMQRPPRDAGAPLFGGAALWLALLQGVGVLAAVMSVFAWSSDRLPEPQARAMAFATLVVGNLALILSNRSANAPIWTTLLVPNRTLWIILALGAGLLMASLQVPWAVHALRFESLAWSDLSLAVGAGLLSVVWFEGIKALRRRPARGRPSVPAG